MFRSTSTSLIVRGVLAIIIGIIAVVWPGVTILALVLLVLAAPARAAPISIKVVVLTTFESGATAATCRLWVPVPVIRGC